MSHYENYYVRMQRLHGREEKRLRYPDSYYVKPFRIIGNVYYIGTKDVCSHLIDTGEGLIVIDTSFPDIDHLLINSIWEAGFNPHDVKIVLHTHAHFDHFGATVSLQKIFGAKAYLGKSEWESVQRKPELAMVPDDPFGSYRMFQPDVLFEDGEVITLGNTSIRCVETPGHTEGTMSFFFDVEEEGRTYHVGTFGGAGFITMYNEFYVRYDVPNLQQTFLQTIEKLKKEKVDVVLGNHQAPNHILEKREQWIRHPETNPYINAEDWPEYLAWVEGEFRQFIEDGN